MAARLIDFGVPHSSILFEKQSQNLVHSKELMRKIPPTTAVIVLRLDICGKLVSMPLNWVLNIQ